MTKLVYVGVLPQYTELARLQEELHETPGQASTQTQASSTNSEATPCLHKSNRESDR